MKRAKEKKKAKYILSTALLFRRSSDISILCGKKYSPHRRTQTQNAEYIHISVEMGVLCMRWARCDLHYNNVGSNATMEND